MGKWDQEGRRPSEGAKTNTVSGWHCGSQGSTPPGIYALVWPPPTLNRADPFNNRILWKRPDVTPEVGS